MKVLLAIDIGGKVRQLLRTLFLMALGGVIISLCIFPFREWICCCLGLISWYMINRFVMRKYIQMKYEISREGLKITDHGRIVHYFRWKDGFLEKRGYSAPVFVSKTQRVPIYWIGANDYRKIRIIADNERRQG